MGRPCECGSPSSLWGAVAFFGLGWEAIRGEQAPMTLDIAYRHGLDTEPLRFKIGALRVLEVAE